MPTKDMDVQLPVVTAPGSRYRHHMFLYCTLSPSKDLPITEHRLSLLHFYTRSFVSNEVHQLL